MFEKADILNIINMKKGLNSIKLVNCENMEDYLNQIYSLAKRINNAAGKTVIEELEVIAIIFAGLPSEYDSWMIVKNATPGKLTLADIESELRAIHLFNSQHAKTSKSEATNNEV